MFRIRNKHFKKQKNIMMFLMLSSEDSEIDRGHIIWINFGFCIQKAKLHFVFTVKICPHFSKL